MTKIFDISTGEQRGLFVKEMLESVEVVHAARVEGTNYTLVILRFMDGWQVEGTSVCVSAADFNLDTGTGIARTNAMHAAQDHYWNIAGYLALIGKKSIALNV